MREDPKAVDCKRDPKAFDHEREKKQDQEAQNREKMKRYRERERERERGKYKMNLFGATMKVPYPCHKRRVIVPC